MSSKPRRNVVSKAAPKVKEKQISKANIMKESPKSKRVPNPRAQWTRGRNINVGNEGSKQATRLNTDVFQTLLENLWTYVSHKQREENTYLDCLWFTDYMNNPENSSVMPWIVKKTNFTKKYVFVPICCWGHWTLIILCNFREKFTSSTSPSCIIFLDSLQSDCASQLEPKVRRFVHAIYQVEGREETEDAIGSIPFLVPQVPQQTDLDGCGYYVLYFIKLFLASAPTTFSLDGYPYFLTKEWFTLEDLDIFKIEIYKSKFLKDVASTVPTKVDDNKIEVKKESVETTEDLPSNQATATLSSTSVTDVSDALGQYTSRTRGTNQGTATPKVGERRAVLQIDGCSFIGASASRDIVRTMKYFFSEPWPTWNYVPKNVKDLLWEKFQEKYMWPADQNSLYHSVWELTSKRRFTTMLESARSSAKKKANTKKLEQTKGHGPVWMGKHIWDALIDKYWSSESWKKKSKSGHDNRLTEKEGSISKHSCGSISFATHKARMSEKLSRPATHLELFEKTHKRAASSDYIDTKSKSVSEEMKGKNNCM